MLLGHLERGKAHRMKISSKSPLSDMCQDWALEGITLWHFQSFLRGWRNHKPPKSSFGKKKRGGGKRGNKRWLKLVFLSFYPCSPILLFWKPSRLAIGVLWNVFERVFAAPPFVLLPRRTNLTLRHICHPLNCKCCPAASGGEKRKRCPGMCSEWMMSPLRSTSAKQVTHKCQYPETEAKLVRAKCVIRTLPFRNVTPSAPLVLFCRGSLHPATSLVGASLSHVGDVQQWVTRLY